MPLRALRRLCKSRPLLARHGINQPALLQVKAFPVPGHLAGNQPIPRTMVARLAGVTSRGLPYYLWRQQQNAS